MSLKSRLSDDMKAALRAKDARRLSALRLLLAAIQQREVDERTTLDDPQVLAVVDKLLKQRRDAAAQFESAGRNDLAEGEKFEIGVLQAYLPPALSAAEIAEAVDRAIRSAGAAGPKDMGKVMAVLKPQLAGRADLAQVSAQVKSRLGN